MTESQLNSFVHDITKPLYDAMQEHMKAFLRVFMTHLPKDMPLQAQEELVKGILQQHSDSLKKSFETSIPKDFEAKLKEALHNGR